MHINFNFTDQNDLNDQSPINRYHNVNSAIKNYIIKKQFLFLYKYVKHYVC